jgi:hypothetical protein
MNSRICTGEAGLEGGLHLSSARDCGSRTFVQAQRKDRRNASPRPGCKLKESRRLWTARRKWREIVRRKPCLQKCTHARVDASPLVNPMKIRGTGRQANGFVQQTRTFEFGRCGEVMKVGKRLGHRAKTRRVCVGGGQTVLELALLLPVLLLLLVGVIEIGRFAYFDILVSNAARAGAQYGAQSLIQAADKNGIQTAAQNDGLTTMAIDSAQQCICGTGTPGGCPVACAQPTTVYVQVTATEKFNSLFSYPGLPKSMTLASTATMRVSQ